MSDDSYSLDDTFDDINQYQVKINKTKLSDGFVKNIKDYEINKIIDLHKDNHINNIDLLDKVEICLEQNILNYSIIEQITKSAIQASVETELVDNLIEFYDFLLEKKFDEKDYKIIREIIKENLNKINKELNNFYEIMLLIKKEIIIHKLNIKEDYIKDLINSCVEKKWSLEKIIIFLSNLKKLYIQPTEGLKDEELLKITKENEQKILTAKTLLNTISSFPNIDLIKIMEKIDFDNVPNIARDFYIECSRGKDNNINELDTVKLLNSLQKLNKNYFTKEKINTFQRQIEICKSYLNKTIDINKWKESELPKYFEKKLDEKNDKEPLKFKENINKPEAIATILGIISLALKNTHSEKNKNFSLRTSQILALLIFIDNHESQEKIAKKEQKGIIEEIATGEGKSIIIQCLAAYFGLKKHKVDIITSSNVLAERDKKKSSIFFHKLKLSVDCSKDSGNELNEKSTDYTADILYGTFLSFEGDLLDQMRSNEEIRKDRKFDIIIIDEVDNAFIDCIEGSTQLSQSSYGYQFLLPMYISIYFFVDILDNIYLDQATKQYDDLISRDDFKNLDEISKKKILDKLSEDTDRKDIFVNYIEKYIRNILEEINRERIYEYNYDTPKKMTQELDDDLKLKNFFYYPFFLKDFIDANLNLWINNAFSAKNEMMLEKNYTISTRMKGYKSITPIDKKNTGELQLSTNYKGGLHQMLQIKEKVRLLPETLDHTFMSHITYFSRYENKRNFFGLTGTIGGEETYPIYKNEYFNSNLVFIPSYIQKRFIELPAIICEENYENHLKEICKEIIFHYSIGRKILVICQDIKEGMIIKELLEKEKFDLEYQDINYKNDILLYLRNDEIEFQEKLDRKKKRIIISTNLGGRGTDIKTTSEIEERGGLHVIITKLSENSRTQKQAFGRTSRQGKKGSGQYIFKEKKGLKTYNQLINDRNEKEKKSIKDIGNNLDYLLLKDNLFIEYVKFINKWNQLIDENGKYIKSDIDEKWALFLSRNVDKGKDKKEIEDAFQIFKKDVENIIKLERHEKFNNNFLRILDAVNIYDNFSNTDELEKYFKFENDSQCFFFASSYYNARVSFEKHKRQFYNNINNDSLCKEIVKYLKETKNKLDKLIELNIEPTLKSFIDWDNITLIDETVQISEKYLNESDRSFIDEFTKRKIIVKNLIKLVEQNINVVQEYIDKYLPTNVKGYEAELDVEQEEDMLKSLGLDDKYENDIKDYITDAGLIYTYKFIIRKKLIKRNLFYAFLFLGFFIFFTLLALVRPLISRGIFESMNKKIKEIFNKYFDYGYVDENNSIFSVIRSKISSLFPKDEEKIKNAKKQKNIYIENKDGIVKYNENLLTIEELKEFEKNTLDDLKKYIKDVFNQNKKEISEQIKFLLFIDYYYSQQNWKDIIINIINDNFEQNEKFKEKASLIKLCNNNNKESHQLAVESLKQIIKESIEQIIKTIKEKFESKEYNMKEIKKLEDIFIKDCSKDMNDKTASEIVTQILTQKIIDKQGYFNNKLFKEEMLTPYGTDRSFKKKRSKKVKDLNEQPKAQSIKIYYSTPYPKNFNKIDNINKLSLSLENIEINDLILQDVQILYLLRNYKNPNELIKKDLTKKIIGILNRLYSLSLIDFNSISEKFFNSLIKKIEEIIGKYLDEEIYPNILTKKGNKKIIRLNQEEQKIYDLISQNSGKKAIDLLESRNFFKLKK